MKNLLFFFSFALLLVGCSLPIRLSKISLTEYDKDTKYEVKERRDGFKVKVFYSSYQYNSESSAIVAASKSAATAIAHEVAETKGRKIKAINEQRIKVAIGRNESSGEILCLAVANVEWE